MSPPLDSLLRFTKISISSSPASGVAPGANNFGPAMPSTFPSPPGRLKTLMAFVFPTVGVPPVHANGGRLASRLTTMSLATRPIWATSLSAGMSMLSSFPAEE